MKRYKLAILLSLVAGVCTAKPVINVSPGIKGGISKTVTESWKLTETEKKNIATTMMMSSLSATAIAPSGKIKKGNWTPLTSQHRMCFYNTFGTTLEGRYTVKFSVAGKEVIAYDKVPVGGGQGFCIMQYLEIWVRGERPGNTPTLASTHVEMDGQATENEGHGNIEVR